MTHHYWNIKVYDSDGKERETLRGLNVARKYTLMQIFERENIQATAEKITEDGKYAGEAETVNP